MFKSGASPEYMRIQVVITLATPKFHSYLLSLDCPALPCCLAVALSDGHLASNDTSDAGEPVVLSDLKKRYP